MTEFLEPSAHGELQEVFPDVFWLRGTYRMWPGGTISRNMTVIREGQRLTVINSVRLDPEEEAKLDALGRVEHVIRLGSFHGCDDRYYVHRYGATLWSQAAQVHEGGLKTDRELVDGGSLPFARARVLGLEHSKRPEAVIVLERHGGILISCDAVQNFVDFSMCSPLCKLMLLGMGFRKPANIGPGYRMMAEDKNRPLAPDFHRILDQRWKHLVPAHGVVLRDSAHAAFRATVERTYGPVPR